MFLKLWAGLLHIQSPEAQCCVLSGLIRKESDRIKHNQALWQFSPGLSCGLFVSCNFAPIYPKPHWLGCSVQFSSGLDCPLRRNLIYIGGEKRKHKDNIKRIWDINHSYSKKPTKRLKVKVSNHWNSSHNKVLLLNCCWAVHSWHCCVWSIVHVCVIVSRTDKIYNSASKRIFYL